jgi:DNA-binding IclR family transcriptional regulator
MTDPTLQTVLQALFFLSRDTRHISATTVATVAGLTPTRAGQALLALERAGLVDATRARLTMRGLVAAARLGAAGGGGIVERRARVQAQAGCVTAKKPVPWAAESERPEPLPAAPCF